MTDTPARAAQELADEICREVAELPDRSSLEGCPQTMLVTKDELRGVVIAVLAAQADTPRRYDGSATEEGARVQADANLRALLRYTEGFYAAAIKHGMRAGETANAIAHIERAGKALHQLVHAWADVAQMRTGEDLQDAESGVALASPSETERLLREVGRQMVNITTTVRKQDEWLCIPELWLQCVKERDDALAKLAKLEGR